jgi:hypothetical protein
MLTMIDTLALAERLEREYGDDPERARRHARILGDMVAAGDVATKQDIQELRTELRSELHEVEQRLRAELHKEISSIAWKLAGLLLAQGAAIVALIKLLPGAAP